MKTATQKRNVRSGVSRRPSAVSKKRNPPKAGGRRPTAKTNPDAVTTFAHLASGILSAVQINEVMKKKTARKKKNPVVVANPRRSVKVPAKGRFYLMTIGRGDDTLGVFINDRDGNGISKKFKTVAAAKSYATRNRLTLENPADPRKVNPQFAPKWAKALLPTEKTKQNVGGFVDELGIFHPIRSSSDYSRSAGGDSKSAPRRRADAVRNLISAAKRAKDRGVYNRLMNKYKDATGHTANTKPKDFPAFKPPVKANPITKVNPRRKRISKAEAKRRAVAAGINFNEDVHSQSWTAMSELAEIAKAAGYRKPKSANGSTARYFFQHLDRLKNPAKPRVPRSRLFENFQGRPTSTVKRYETSIHVPSRLIQLGDLLEIKLAGERPIKINGDRVKLCATQAGKLAIVGKRFAKVNPALKRNEISRIGEIDHVVYRTHKPHHGDQPGQAYIHKLGEVSGKMPTLYVDRDGFPLVRGGNYRIRPEGIVD